MTPHTHTIMHSVDDARAAVTAARRQQRLIEAALEAAEADPSAPLAVAVSRDEDEAEFSQKEARRLAKDVGRLNPTVLWGGAGGSRQKGIDPSGQHEPSLDALVPLPVPPSRNSFPHPGFESVGGSVGGAVQTLKEMVLLPLLYPELLLGMGTVPPG